MDRHTQRAKHGYNLRPRGVAAATPNKQKETEPSAPRSDKQECKEIPCTVVFLGDFASLKGLEPSPRPYHYYDSD